MSPHEITAAAEAKFHDGVRYATEFFMGKASVQRALGQLVDRLEQLELPYAIAGAMALNEYGYIRVTVDVDVVLTRESLETFKRHWLGRGYLEKFPGSRGFRDTENNVGIDVLITGEYPGDGRPKSVSFPDPAQVSRRGAHGRFLPLERLIELKIASGMSAPHRLRDLADVLEVIHVLKLQEDFAGRLDESVREKYLELWQAARDRPDTDLDER